MTPARGRDAAMEKIGFGETKELEGNQSARLTPQDKMQGVRSGIEGEWEAVE